MKIPPYISISNAGKVFLMLDKDPRDKICLGYLDSAESFHCVRNFYRQVYGNQRAISFNHELMITGKFTFVVVHNPFTRDYYVTTRMKIIREGFFIELPQNKPDKQIYLPLGKFMLNSLPVPESPSDIKRAEKKRQLEIFRGIT